MNWSTNQDGHVQPTKRNLLRLTVKNISWILNLESWILNLESWILNLESWILNLESWILNLESWILNLESWILNLESWILNLESWISSWKIFLINSYTYFWCFDKSQKMRPVSSKNLKLLQTGYYHYITIAMYCWPYPYSLNPKGKRLATQGGGAYVAPKYD